jgi:hypothetical protein
MKLSVILRDVSCQVHDTTDPNMPCKKNVAAPDVVMSASLVMFDEHLSFAVENNDDDDYNDNNNGTDTKKFASPTSKQCKAGCEETD